MRLCTRSYLGGPLLIFPEKLLMHDSTLTDGVSHSRCNVNNYRTHGEEKRSQCHLISLGPPQNTLVLFVHGARAQLLQDSLPSKCIPSGYSTERQRKMSHYPNVQSASYGKLGRAVNIVLAVAFFRSDHSKALNKAYHFLKLSGAVLFDTKYPGNIGSIEIAHQRKDSRCRRTFS